MNIAKCIWSVLSSISNLNRCSSSLGLFFQIPLKRGQRGWDWRIRLNDTPYAIGCICKYVYIYMYISIYDMGMSRTNISIRIY